MMMMMMKMMMFSQIYRGYVDDPRNTDNAWMETVVMHFHDESGEKVDFTQPSPVRNYKCFRSAGFLFRLETMLWPFVGWS